MKKFSRILGTGSCLPKKIVTNQDLEKIVDTSDEWIVSRSGIKSRHIAEDSDTTADLAVHAAKLALEKSGLEAKQIDMVIVGTASSDDAFPSTASVVQHKLGLGHVAAFDVSAACAGFNHGVSIADQFIKTGFAKHVLVIGCEMLSRAVDWTDRTTCVLFGDGAGAVILGVSDEPGIYSTHLHCDGSQHDILYAPNLLVQRSSTETPFVKMQGREVFRHAVTRLGELVDETLEANNFKKSDIDWLVPHQANIRIIQATAKKLDLPMEKVVVTLDRHGNTSAASIPLALDFAISDGRIKRGDLILLESFGGGLVWGSALIRY